jgi:hypothetical protein
VLLHAVEVLPGAEAAAVVAAESAEAAGAAKEVAAKARLQHVHA